MSNLSIFQDRPEKEALELLQHTYRLLASTKDKRKKRLIFEELDKYESAAIDVNKGLYFGHGYNMREGFSEPKRIILDWGKLDNHMNIFGTTRMGKTRQYASLQHQLILHGDNVVGIDPKGSKGHELLAWNFESAYKAGRLNELIYMSPAYADFSFQHNVIHMFSNEEIASLFATLASGAATKAGDFFIEIIYKNTLTIAYALEYIEEALDPFNTIRREDELSELFRWVINNEFKGIIPSAIKSATGTNSVFTPDVVERMYRSKIEIPSRKITAVRTLATIRDFAYFSVYKNLSSLGAMVRLTPLPDKTYVGNKKYEKLHNLRNLSLLLLDDVAGKKEEYYEKISNSFSTMLLKLSTGGIGKLYSNARVNPLAFKMRMKNQGLILNFQPYPLKFKAVSDMAVKIFFMSLQSLYGGTGATGRTIAKRTYIIVDEAKPILYPGIEEILNKLGGLGVTMWFLSQSMSDWEYSLGPVLKKVAMDNINTTLSLRVNEVDSLDILSKTFGKYVKTTSKFNVRDTGSMFGGIERDPSAELVPPDSISRLKMGYGYLKHDGETYFIKLPFVADAKLRIEFPEDAPEETSAYLGDAMQTLKTSESEMLKWSLKYQQDGDNQKIKLREEEIKAYERLRNIKS